jgi:leucyl aminopeptidase (aminopeptidase T)
MQAVVDRLEVRQNWRNWQVVQKQQKEEGQKRAMLGGKERLEQAVIDSARELLDEWDALAEAKETKEAMMSKEEWREMSSKGRSRLAAWL